MSRNIPPWTDGLQPELWAHVLSFISDKHSREACMLVSKTIREVSVKVFFTCRTHTVTVGEDNTRDITSLGRLLKRLKDKVQDLKLAIIAESDHALAALSFGTLLEIPMRLKIRESRFLSHDWSTWTQLVKGVNSLIIVLPPDSPSWDTILHPAFLNTFSGIEMLYTVCKRAVPGMPILGYPLTAPKLHTWQTNIITVVPQPQVSKLMVLGGWRATQIHTNFPNVKTTMLFNSQHPFRMVPSSTKVLSMLKYCEHHEADWFTHPMLFPHALEMFACEVGARQLLKAVRAAITMQHHSLQVLVLRIVRSSLDNNSMTDRLGASWPPLVNLKELFPNLQHVEVLIDWSDEGMILVPQVIPAGLERVNITFFVPAPTPCVHDFLQSHTQKYFGHLRMEDLGGQGCRGLYVACMTEVDGEYKRVVVLEHGSVLPCVLPLAKEIDSPVKKLETTLGALHQHYAALPLED